MVALKSFLILVTTVAWSAAVLGAGGDQKTRNDAPPKPSREFRGAWVATVGNIDWPSKPGLSTPEQQAELVAIIEKAVQLKLNALIFQVRPACDALYPSRLDPWSEYLTGKMGQPPEPMYDPLAFAIEQAHQRGIELHAWFNPYRARYRSTKSPISANHISRTHPKLVRTYGKYLWLDPAEKQVQEHSKAVILDVVRRYNIDGVHLDDYFYPYREKDASGKPMEFPDEPAWKRYRAAGGKLDRGDWRRKHVDDFLRNLYRSIKAEKPWVKFGISPFGIWRPGHPEQIVGLDAYDQIYADSRKWMNQGWADYFAPQLYWADKPPGQSYSALLKWWAGQNSQNRHLWPGNNSAKVGAGWTAEEILNQIRLTRQQTGATGNIYWNMASLLRDAGGLATALSKNLYSQPALLPASPWLDKKPPGKPKLSIQKDNASKALNVSWKNTDPESVWLWVVQARTAGKWRTEILPGKQTSRSLSEREGNSLPDLIAVTAVDRCSNAGPTSLLETAVDAKMQNRPAQR